MPSASDDLSPSGRFVLVGNPECRRVRLFGEAVARAGLPPPFLVSWLDLLRGRTHLAEAVCPADIVRIESPGRDWEVERALLERGAEVADSGAFERISRRAAAELVQDRGRILSLRQWYLGFREMLGQLERELSECPEHRRMNDPAEIARMFDKPRCHADLQAASLPVPRSLGIPASYEDLRESMERTGCRRVFVKPAHGSSASGVVAYQTDGTRHRAVSTVEMVTVAGEVRLYNNRRQRVYQEAREIAVLIDALCRQRVHVEEWLPKAGIAGRTFDLRVLVVAGEVRQVVPRLSRTPMTNLHLLNGRGDLDGVRERTGPEAWERLRETCRRTLGCFPRSLYAGLDVAISPEFRRHAVLEVNGFGDLLPGLLCEGKDSYSWEVEAALRPGGKAAGEAECRTLAS